MRLTLIENIGKEYGLDANELSVYSAIASFSKGRGWFASYTALTNQLPFVISTKTIERVIKRLTTLGLIEKRGKAFYATTNCPPPATDNLSTTDNSSTDNLSSATDTLSPANRQIVPTKQTNSPSKADNLYLIYNKENKERVRDNIIDSACDTIDTPNPSTPSPLVKPSVQPLSSFDQRSVATAQPLSSFDELLVAYKSQNANANPSSDLLTAARNLWDDLPDYRQQQLLDALQAGSWNKPRLDWLISDFNFREPTNYLGKEQPRGYSYYFAWHNGARGLYIKQDVDAFHMSNPEHFMDL